MKHAHDGAAALEIVASLSPDVVLLDVKMPGGLDGFEVCRRIRSDPATRLTPVVIVTGLHGQEERILGIEAGADDFLSKPVDRVELLARVRSLVRIKQHTDDLDSATSIVMTLASMIESRDGYGEGHCHRMANYATGLGRALWLDEADVRSLYRGAFLHDIGMLTVADSILQKPGPLSPDERERIRSHTVVGDRALQQPAVAAVRAPDRAAPPRAPGRLWISGRPSGTSCAAARADCRDRRHLRGVDDGAAVSTGDSAGRGL